MISKWTWGALGASFGLASLVAWSSSAVAAPKRARPGANAVNQSDQALFETICGKGNDAWANGRRGCRRCPAYTSFADDSEVAAPKKGEKAETSFWPDLQFSGSFTHAGAREQLVVVGGPCEAHVSSYGGSLLLDRSQGTPRVIEYDRGFVPLACKQHEIEGGRSALLCETGFTQTDIIQQSVVLRDFAQPWREDGASSLFTVEDDWANVCELSNDDDPGQYTFAHLIDFGWSKTSRDSHADAVATIEYTSFASAALARKHCGSPGAEALMQTAQLKYVARALQRPRARARRARLASRRGR